MGLSRRKFIKRGLQTLSVAAAHGLLQPRFLIAQTPPGRYKNLVYIFLYGGSCPRFTFPYLGGPVDQAIRDRRPNISISPGSVWQLAGMNQGGRANPIGFHPSWNEFISTVQGLQAGVTIISEYGVTTNRNYSHDYATKQHLNATPRAPGAVEQGLFGRVADALRLPSLAVWGMNFNEPGFFASQFDQPMMVTSLSAFDFVNRNFGGFNCGALPGQICGASGDLYSTAADDSALARSIAKQIAAEVREEMPLAETIRHATEGIFSSVPAVKAINLVPITMSLFRPAGQGGSPTAFQNSVSDIAKAIKTLNSNDPSVPQSLRDSTKLFACGLDGWDSHAAINSYHPYLISNLGAALKGLVYHLEQWGLLQSTLIMVGTEFGRTIAQNSGFGIDHGNASYCLLIGGNSLIGRRVLGPEASLSEATHQNIFTAQLPVTGVLKQVLGNAGIGAQLFPQIFPDAMPGEDLVPSIFI